MSLFRRPDPPAPYFQGYLAATARGTQQQDGGIVRMPAAVYSDGSAAQKAYIEGVSDSIMDRAPRFATDRVSRAYPPWRMI